jgi:hypothetical protein
LHYNKQILKTTNKIKALLKTVKKEIGKYYSEECILGEHK